MKTEFGGRCGLISEVVAWWNESAFFGCNHFPPSSPENENQCLYFNNIGGPHNELRSQVGRCQRIVGFPTSCCIWDLSYQELLRLEILGVGTVL